MHKSVSNTTCLLMLNQAALQLGSHSLPSTVGICAVFDKASVSVWWIHMGLINRTLIKKYTTEMTAEYWMWCWRRTICQWICLFSRKLTCFVFCLLRHLTLQFHICPLEANTKLLTCTAGMRRDVVSRVLNWRRKGERASEITAY